MVLYNSLKWTGQLAEFSIAALADVLVRDSLRLSPKLLLTMKTSGGTLSASQIDVNEAGPHPAVTDSATNLTVIFDPVTFLPSRVRSVEDHLVLGPSANDYLLYNYTMINGVNFPRNFKVLYNEDLMLIEMLVDQITVNPTFDANFFAGLPLSQVNSTTLALPPTAPQGSAVYGQAEVFEMSYVNMIKFVTSSDQSEDKICSGPDLTKAHCQALRPQIRFRAYQTCTI